MKNNRVKELRDEMHISQETLGKRVNISQQVISKIEGDDRRMTRDNMLALADFFNVSTDYLIGRSKVRRNVEQDKELLSLYERNCTLMSLYEMLDEKNQELIQTLLEKMVEQENRCGSR